MLNSKICNIIVQIYLIFIDYNIKEIDIDRDANIEYKYR